MNRRRGLRAALWIIGSVVVVAAILVGGWMLWPVLGLDTAAEPRTAETDPPLSIPEPTSPTPTPSATPLPLSDPGVSLAFAADGSLWRTTDGSCAKGIRPKVERSADGGSTWTDITPTVTDPREILALNGTGPIPFEMVVLTGDQCRLAGVGTYTSGRYWYFYDRVLGDSTFIAPDASTISAAGTQVPLPCQGAFGPVAGADGTLTTLCPATGLQSWVSQAWVALTDSRVISTAAAGSGRVMAIDATNCDGVLIGGFRNVAAPRTGGQGFCVAGIHPTEGVAVAVSGGQIYLWDGVNFTHVAVPAS